MVLRLRYPAPGNWQNAKCRKLDVSRQYDPFFNEEEYDEAKAFCSGEADGIVCPIREECGLYALTNNCSIGVYGGMDEITRKAIRRKWPLKHSKVPRPEWKYMSHQEALDGIDPETLIEDEEEEFD
jgi:hypothetical protein